MSLLFGSEGVITVKIDLIIHSYILSGFFFPLNFERKRGVYEIGK